MSGPLFLIGGHEDKTGERAVLRAVAQACTGGPLALVSAPSREPERYLPLYQDAFGPLGVDVVELRLRDRAASDEPRSLALLERAGGVFITGGAQLRGAKTLRDSLAVDRIRDCWEGGIPVAGTSAGAALLGEWMLGRGANDDSPNVDGLDVERGLGFLRGVLIDQHLAQRGRTPRLLAASALEGVVGIGIDEDTAARVNGRTLEVIGSGAVTVIDTAGASARRSGGGVSVRNALVHVITRGDEPFDLSELAQLQESAQIQ